MTRAKDLNGNLQDAAALSEELLMDIIGGRLVDPNDSGITDVDEAETEVEAACLALIKSIEALREAHTAAVAHYFDERDDSPIRFSQAVG